MTAETSRMSLREKIGQMVMVGFPGTEIDATTEHLIRDYKMGNFILFSRNIQSEEQVRALCAALQKLAQESCGHPAFISVDQEGGMVSRLPKDGVSFPGAMALAATGDVENAFLAGKYTGEELADLGINVDIAPVLDINSNRDNPVIGVRSFGDTRETVSRFGVRMMQGLQESGVMPVVKHFPGHGDTAVDSHLGLPVIRKTLAQLQANELAPFAAAFAQGADSVMSSHILFPEIEHEKVPATMSRTMLTDVLKHTLGFGGLVMTDCLEMDAIHRYYGTAEGALAAVRAGAHLLCISHTVALAVEAVERIASAVGTGTLPRSVIDEAVEQVLRFKARYASRPASTPDAAAHAVRRQAARRISAQSVTLVRGSVPHAGARTLFIGGYASRSTLASSAADESFSFSKTMSERFGARGLLMSTNPDEEETTRLLHAADGNFDHVVVATYNGHLNRGQIELVNRLCALHAHVTAVALRNPYDLALVDARANALAAYEYTPLSLESLAGVFAGEIEPQGHLSVTI